MGVWSPPSFADYLTRKVLLYASTSKVPSINNYRGGNDECPGSVTDHVPHHLNEEIMSSQW